MLISDASLLENIDKVFNPLFCGQMSKIFNPEKMVEYQKKIKKSSGNDEDMELDFDEKSQVLYMVMVIHIPTMKDERLQITVLMVKIGERIRIH